MKYGQDVCFSIQNEAIVSLKEKNLGNAYDLILQSMQHNPDAPEPQNLLGILSEIKGDDSMARKHYRAAYALDPAYKPAQNNLERLCKFTWGTQSRDFDYGESQKA